MSESGFEGQDFTESTGPEVPETPGGAEQTGGINPAWNEVLEILPAEFRGQVTPHLQKWDQSVNQRFEKVREEAVQPYQHFQPFVEQQVDPNQLQASWKLWNDLNSDPLSIYNRMGEQLRSMGLLEEAKAIEQAGQEAEAEEEFKDPRVDELLRAQQEFQQQFQAEQALAQQEAQVRQYAEQFDNQVKTDFATIEQQFGGPLPDALRLEVINRAAMLTDLEQRNVSLVEAYDNLMQFQSQMQQFRPGTQAPRVVPGGGGFPAPQANPEALKTVDGRAAAIKDIIDRHNS